MMEQRAVHHPILAKAQRLGRLIQQAEEVHRFRAAETQVEKSVRVQGLIDEIKRKQKELVHAKHYQKTEYIRQVEADLDRLNAELDQLPIVREYQQSQVEMNDLLQMLQQAIADTVSKKIEVETGGEAPGGCGSGGPCGCR
jgi:cell fate (sporulation/competence/biofilm development) regulator YmcA (YheA/YmcA/DUF963 family)